jgi:soluble lytic murein transglycosylase-like protein
MRQESGFAPNARNHSGAAGLMQLMPATARSMAARTGEPLAKGRKNTGNALSDPGYNLMLAQEYVRMLLQDGNIKNNLILFAAAYNRGPAGVAKWQNDRPEYAKDPLLFLESIPSQQSRVFVLRVMTNYWGYRQRLSQPTPDLDALAAGKWPTYTAFDGTAVAKAGAEKANRHAQN